jgi:hypothetical protein
MTKEEEIIEMARQSGAMFDHMTHVERDLFPVLYRFAELVAEKEREACANICETLELPDWPDKVRQPLAQAIRARGQA